MTPSTPTPGTQVRQLLFLLSSGVIAAIVVALGLITYYGPTGNFVVKSILISPETLKDLNYKAVNPETGKEDAFVFARLELMHFDNKDNKWIAKQLDFQKYQEFYQTIASQESVPQGEQVHEKTFLTSNPASLAIVVQSKEKKGTKEGDRVFQEVQLLPKEGLYRIELHQTYPLKTWAYFENDGLEEIVAGLIGGSNE